MASTNISFDQIPASIRKPGKYFEFNTTNAVRTLAANSQKMLIIAQKAEDSDAPLVPVQIYDDATAGALFGYGSQAQLMVQAAIRAYQYLDLSVLPESEFDSPLGTGSGAGAIFGATGGVMEAALRSAYFLTTGENPSADAFCEVRAAENESRPWREAAFDLAGTTIHCAVASGLANARHLIRAIKRREVHYEFVEIMACPGGCAGGGGQPVDGSDREKAASRGDVLFSLDEKAELRFSHENPAVKALYNEYLSSPCSERAEELLHCDHFAWQMPQTGIHV